MVGIVIVLIGGFIIYGVVKVVIGLWLDEEVEFIGVDLVIYKIGLISEE